MAYKQGHNDVMDELRRQTEASMAASHQRNMKKVDPDDPDLFLHCGNSAGRLQAEESHCPDLPDDFERIFEEARRDMDKENRSQPPFIAYNADFQGDAPTWSAAKLRRGNAPPSYPRDPAPYTREVRPQKPPQRKEPDAGPRVKKKHIFLKLCLVLAILAGGLVGLFFSMLEQPMTDMPIGSRKAGASTILLCGTDEDGYRTDTMMLLYVNAREHAMNLVSLPRDTLTWTTAGEYAKLNSAFGRNNGAEDPENGMYELMGYVADLIGYRPDGYMLIDLDIFIDAVDLMGGVDYNVPMNMYYEDPSQDLYIDLPAGLQHLDGYQAMGLVRYRSGYADQDLGRVDTQRDFLAACIDQWLSPSSLLKAPRLLKLLEKYTISDLKTGNLLWLAWNGWRAGFGNLESGTLPGYADMRDGVSYYVLNPYEVAYLVNDACNPYETQVTVDDFCFPS